VTNPFTAKAKAKHKKTKRAPDSPFTAKVATPGERVSLDELEKGDRLWVKFRWGPIQFGTPRPPAFIVEGVFAGTDPYNLIVKEDGGRDRYIPVACIRQPSWLRRIDG
jgi:hypothetical protein